MRTRTASAPAPSRRARQRYEREGGRSADASQSCEGCPNQQACSTAPKGPDPGALCRLHSHTYGPSRYWCRSRQNGAREAQDPRPIGQRFLREFVSLRLRPRPGGVGKSTFSAQLSFALAAAEKQVGLLDIDICGPSIPKILGVEVRDSFALDYLITLLGRANSSDRRGLVPSLR